MGRRGRPKKILKVNTPPPIAEQIVQLIRELEGIYIENLKIIRKELIASRAKVLNLREEIEQEEE